MTEKPPEWSPAVPLAEVERRMGAIAADRLLALPPADRKAVHAAKHPQTIVGTDDPTWLALWVELDDGTRVDLGRLHRATLHEDPPGMS
jgi:hypothetical protein